VAETLMKVQSWALEQLKPFSENARLHSPEQVAQIAASIREFGFNNPILVDHEGTIIAGHGRVEAAHLLGLGEVPVIVIGHLTEEQRRAYTIADNKIALNSSWSIERLQSELRLLSNRDFDLSLIGFSEPELLQLLPVSTGSYDSEGNWEPADGSALSDASSAEDPFEQREAVKLADRFLVPPFSVLDARQGYWRQRKQQWLAMGIESEIGRGGNLLKMSDTMLQPDPDRRLTPTAAEYKTLLQQHGTSAASLEAKIPNYYQKRARGMTDDEIVADFLENSEMASGTSIFDPVICEIAYRWFSPVNGTILDPFAGGSVRGIVASKLDRDYHGVDLRLEQIEANREQASRLCDGSQIPNWICGDSKDLDTLLPDLEADLVFSCPPYADLEVYSDDPKDISTMEYEQFLDAYREIIRKAVAMLKPDRFACFVVGEVREKNRSGFYRNFVLDTIQAFEDAGANFYNEMVLVTPTGTLAMRTGRTFAASRKVGKNHQNVLVFVKGDPIKAVEACGTVEVSLPVGMDDPTAEVEFMPEPREIGEIESQELIGGEL